MLESRLMEQDVAAASIEVVADEQAALQRGLEASRAGDLLVVFGDNVVRCWKQIINFESGEGVPAAADSSSGLSLVEENPQAFMLEPGDELIRDERGVRIARQDVEDGD
jgi:cyanophycin synthetase